MKQPSQIKIEMRDYQVRGLRWRAARHKGHGMATEARAAAGDGWRASRLPVASGRPDELGLPTHRRHLATPADSQAGLDARQRLQRHPR